MDDAQHIANCIYAYAERIDLGDFEGVAQVLAHAAVTFEGVDGAQQGVDALTALYASTTKRYDDGTPKTKHVTTNVAVTVDGATGSASSYFTVLQAVPGLLPLQPIIAGRYRDRFENVDGQWRFSARHVMVDLMGDLSAHLKIEL